VKKEIIQNELQFKAVRSSGAGGQNVNKVSSKVILFFSVENSMGLNDEEKILIKEKLVSKLNNDLVLILSCDEDRSQFRNKEIVTKRFFETLKKALTKPKIRKATKTPKSAVEKRLKEKKSISETKNSRKKPEL
jgi:ribosome-associated protein